MALPQSIDRTLLRHPSCGSIPSPRQDEDRCCVIFLPYREHGFIRFTSDRTRETLFEIKMTGGSIIVWGAHYRPYEFQACLTEDGATVGLAGTLRDRLGTVVIFGDHLTVAAGFRVEIGRLPADYDPSWSRDRS